MKSESAPGWGASADSGDEVGTQPIEELGHESEAWGKVPRHVAKMTLTKDALRVFIALSSFADGKSRLAWPSQVTLAQELGWITGSTGQPDRRRVSNALHELLDVDAVRRAGRQTFGVRAWTNRFLVAPFPQDAEPFYASQDAEPLYASSEDGPQIGAEDAYEAPSRTRMNHVHDAGEGYAQTDPLNRPEESERIVAARNENEEDQGHRQGQDPRPNPWASLPGRGAHDAA